MRPSMGTIIVARDIGCGWGVQPVRDLAVALEQRLHHPAMVSFPESEEFPLVEQAESLALAGKRRIVILPLGLLPISEKSSVGRSLGWLNRNRSDLTFEIAAPLTWLEWGRWLGTIAVDHLVSQTVSPEKSGLLLVGNPTSDPMSNANLPRLAHLIRETSTLAEIRYAFSQTIRPTVSDQMRELAATGIAELVVLPWQIPDGDAIVAIQGQIEQAAAFSGLRVTMQRPNLSSPAFVNLLVSNHFTAQSIEFNPVVPPVSSASGDSSPETDELAASAALSEAEQLRELERRINELLPPQYQGTYEDVSPQSMGTASLKYDEQGRVAWGEIWTSFCDLALAGGPPHRGKLLEAVSAADAMAEREQYDTVVAEIERGIRLVTSLPTVSSESLGWVGVRCESEEMAVWLMRAIIVENVMVRREKDVIYLPAGPRFTVKREIKNVITAIAKTVHYWSAHLNARRRSAEGS